MKPFLLQQLERYAERLAELDFLLSRQDIMGDMAQFMKLSREHADVAAVAQRYARYRQRQADLQAAREMQAELPESDEMHALAGEEIAAAEREIAALDAELQRMLQPKDPQDARNAFMEIRAGTGGDESALFAGDLLRMYTRYAQNQGWKVELLSESPGELGGYKEVVVRIEGDGVFGQLRFESGGHRVQRVPATETQGRIHTSACTVAVLAEHAIPFDAYHHFLVAAEFAGGFREQFDLPALALGVAGVHAQQVACEQGRFVATGARADFQISVARVLRVFGQQHALQLGLQRGDVALGLGNLFSGQGMHLVGRWQFGLHLAGRLQIAQALFVAGVALCHGSHIGMFTRELHELRHVGHDVFAREQKIQLGQTVGVAFEL